MSPSSGPFIVSALCIGFFIGYIIAWRVYSAQAQYWRKVAQFLSSVAAFQQHLTDTLERARAIFTAFGAEEAWQFTVAEIEAYRPESMSDPIKPDDPMDEG